MLKLSNIAFVLAIGVAFSTPATAQRRIVGGESLDNEDEKDKKAAEEKKKKAAEEKKKAAEDADKRDEKKQKAAEDREKAREAAEKAAEEAEKKKKTEEERVVQEKLENERRRLDSNRAERLQQAKKSRRFFRQSGKIIAQSSMAPGAPTKDTVVEIRVDLTRKLDVPHPRYGDFEPLPGSKLVVLVSPPDTGRGDDEALRYRLRALPTPGSYGFHFTPVVDGEHKVTVSGKTKNGDDVNFEFSVHADVWPPPDLDDEEAKQKTGASGARSGRRVVGGGDDD